MTAVLSPVDLSKPPPPELVRMNGDQSYTGDDRRALGDEFERRRLERVARNRSPQAQEGTLTPADQPEPSDTEKFVMVRASDVEMKPVRWTWDQRMPAGALTLLAGREGLGKSTLSLWAAARLTRGELPGMYERTPKSVMVVATEDGWAHTIRPRLMAAGADLDRVLFMRHQTAEGKVQDAVLEFPLHVDLLRQAVAVTADDIVLVILDPLMSRLNSRLDSHRDADVRQGLEPLVSFADDTGVAVLGLIHLNKSQGVDPLTAVMGSRAFVAVARSVLVALANSEDEGSYVLAHGKSNLGARASSEGYVLQGVKVDGSVVMTEDIWSSRARWTGTVDRSAEDIHEANGGDDEAAPVDEGANWLRNYLADAGGAKASRMIKEAATWEGHSWRTIQRARKRLKLKVEYDGPATVWRLSEPSSPSVSEVGQ